MNTLAKWVCVTFDAEGASAKNCAFVHGVPPPSAAWGMAQRMALDSGAILKGGVAFVLHDYNDRGAHSKYGRTIYSLQRSAQRDVQEGAPDTQVDLPRCDLSATLVFQAAFSSAEHVDMMARLEPTRFSGGVIDWGTLRVSTFDRRSSALLRTPPGFAMVECLTPNLTIDGLIDAVTPVKGRKGWRTPSLLGYQLIEEPVQRPGARHGLPHAYADPLVGVVEWKSFFDLRRSDGSELTFWSPKWVTSKTVLFQNSSL